MAERLRTWQLDRVFPTDTGEAKLVLDQLLGQLAEHRWAEDDVFAVHLAVEEALMNAIKHGNRWEKQKRVHVRSELCDHFFRIEITDEGAGFDPAGVPDPTLDENLDLPSGRGLMLMRTFMSEVAYNALGNQVTMVKRRDASVAD